jgi:hypothetical protein
MSLKENKIVTQKFSRIRNLYHCTVTAMATVYAGKITE